MKIILQKILNSLNAETYIKIIIIIIFTNPSARAGYDTRSIFKQSLTGLHSEFSFSQTCCLSKAEEPSLYHYLPIAGRRIFGCLPFPRVLVLCEMQYSPSIWNRIAVSISYDDNHYITGTIIIIIMIIIIIIRKYIDRESKNIVEHYSEGDTNCNWCYWYSYQRIYTRNWGLGN